MFFPTSNTLLGKWASKQRIAKSQNLLTSTQIEMLDSFGFVWDPPKVENNEWTYHFKTLKEALETTGKADFPSNSVSSTVNFWERSVTLLDLITCTIYLLVSGFTLVDAAAKTIQKWWQITVR
jgi:hypothetical protein